MFGDCHMHAVLDGKDFRKSIASHSGPDGPDETAIRKMLASYRDAGVTYLRDGGDRWGTCLMARRIAPEYGIEYVAPGAPFYRVGDYGKFIGTGYETVEDFKELVKQAKAEGVDFIKIMITGIMDFDHYGVISGTPVDPETVRAIISIAHDAGFAVMAHTNGARAVQAAVEAGVDSIEHGAFSDEESRACLAESNTIWVPTLSPVMNLIGEGRFDDDVLKRIGSEQMQAVAEVADMGGSIALGDDAGAYGVPHGSGAIDELGLMRQALGDRADEVLADGLEKIRTRFKRIG
jgi:hypothetical protein